MDANSKSRASAGWTNLKFKYPVMKKKFLNFPVLLSLLFVVSVYADPATGSAASEPEEKPRPRAWFVQTGIPHGMDNPVKVLVGGKIEMLTLSNRVSSGPVKIPKDGIIRLVKEVSNPEDKEEVIYQTLAEAVVPEGLSKVLIIMVPRPKPAPDGSLYMTKVQPLNGFKGGDFLYINLTDARIGIEIASDKMMLNSGEMKIHGVKGGGKLVSVPYRYSYYHVKKKKWIPLNASMTISSLTRREVFIFSKSESSGRIRCKGVTFPVEN